MRAIPSIFAFLLLTIFHFSCTRQVEEFQPGESSKDYISLQPGKYITYRLDSTVFTQQGRAEETHSYQEKVIIDAEMPDALGRPGYRVYRFIRDVNGTEPWVSSGTNYMLWANGNLEVTENNFKVLKLVSPVREGDSWKANRYITLSPGSSGFASGPYSPKYQFDNNRHIYLNEWDFTYESKGESIVLNGKTINDVVTVKGPDETGNIPVTDPGVFGSQTYVEYKFAKGIGLIYEEYILQEYQPNSGGSPYKTGFKVKRSMLDHN